MSRAFDLDVVCTDRGTHPPRHLMRVTLAPDSLDADGFAVWSADEEPRHLRANPTPERSRTARTSGRQLHVRQAGVGERTRGDGGRTFILPTCLSCGEQRDIRDRTLIRYFQKARDTPLEGAPLDVSLVIK